MRTFRNWAIVALMVLLVILTSSSMSAQVDGDDTDTIPELVSGTITSRACEVRWTGLDKSYRIKYNYSDGTSRLVPITGPDGISKTIAPKRNFESVEVLDRDGKVIYCLKIDTDFGVLTAGKKRLVPA